MRNRALAFVISCAALASLPGATTRQTPTPKTPTAQAPAAPAARPQPLRTQVVLLGTGTPNADPDRSGSAVAIVVDDVPYLFDFGPGVVRRAAAAFKKGVKGLDVKLLRTAFVTHLHSDHTAGYPDLIFTPAVLERDAPLEVYGPKGIKEMTGNVVRAWADDMDIRLHGLEPTKPAGYVVNAHEIVPGMVFGDSRVAVTAFPVRHGAWKQAYGYKILTPDRSIVISGDTVPSDTVVGACNGCDILIHEVYSTAGFATRPPEWQRYHRAYHTSSSELADLAARARPGLLVLTHQLRWGVSEEALVAEVKRGYAGNVVSGRDLDVF
jgi:ribonuclease BN (tRNA processing enzyme)